MPFLGCYSPGVVMSSLALGLLFVSDTQGNTKLITNTIYYLKLNKKAIMAPRLPLAGRKKNKPKVSSASQLVG